MSAQPDLNDLARQASNGDALAFEEIARILTPLLVGFFLRRGGCDAEELTQQTWLKVAGGFDTYDPKRDFKTWLFSIAYYRWVDSLASDNHHPGPILGDIPESSMQDPITGAEFCAALHGCMEQLTDLDRKILLLRYWNGMSLKEVADKLDKPYSSVKGRVDRARVGLRACIQKKFP